MEEGDEMMMVADGAAMSANLSGSIQYNFALRRYDVGAVSQTLGAI